VATRDRVAFGYVVAVEAGTVAINIRDTHRGRMAVVEGGVTPILQVGALLGIPQSTDLLVAEVSSVEFAESREAHRARAGTSIVGDEPLRQLKARIVGRLVRRDSSTALDAANNSLSSASDGRMLEFIRGSTITPALGTEAIPLSPDELEAVSSRSGNGTLEVGRLANVPIHVRVRLNDLLSRHVIVTGSTGQGKSCLTAAILQRLLAQYSRMRSVLFDVNGEYTEAFEETRDGKRRLCNGVKVTRLAPPDQSAPDHWQLPYYTLGRNGLEALLVPSERAQRPALRFGLSALPYVEWKDDGVCLGGEAQPALFDDCRTGKEKDAKDALDKLREAIRSGKNRAAQWPPLKTLAPLIAEYVALQPDKSSFKRDSFHYGHVSTLVRRVHSIAEDVALGGVVDMGGSGNIPQDANADPWLEAQKELLEKIYGLKSDDADPGWKLHLVDLHLVPHDVLPFILGGILSALLDELFRRGPGNTAPLLLILEEAHHYLRRLYSDEGDASLRELLAYERLAKEGRKFGVSLWLSTQRPSELSQTVLAQCGTWFCLRLTAQSDLERVRHASEWADQTTIQRIAALPRQEAIAFGSAFSVPVHLRLPDANPRPRSDDPPFQREWTAGAEGSTVPGNPEAEKGCSGR
jgi:hypothetical protein